MKRTTLLIALLVSASYATATAQNQSAPRVGESEFLLPEVVVPEGFSSLALPAVRNSERSALYQKASEAVFCTTSQLQEVWLDDEESWDPFSKSESMCDDTGHVTETAFQTHYLDEWELSTRFRYTYDESGNRLEMLIQRANMDGTGYDNDRRLVYEYNGENVETQRLEQDWDGSVWVNTERRLQFEDGGFLVSLDQEWDGAAWQDVERDRSNLEDSTTVTETWDGSMWLPAVQAEFDVNGDVSIQTNRMWDGSQWVNDSRYSQSPEFRRVEEWDGSQWVGVQNQLLTYDAFDNLVELIEQEWDGTGWVNDYRATYVFDATGSFQTEFQLDDWDESGWVDDSRQVSTVDANGYEVEELWQDWNETESKWENVQRYTRTYETINLAVEPVVAANGFVLSVSYPNPAGSSVVIGFELSHTAHVDVALFDVVGRRVRTLHSGVTPAGVHEIEVDVSRFASGLYYYQLRSPEAVLTRQMTIVR